MRLTFFAAAVLCVSSLAAHADTINFTFLGSEQTGFGGTSTGVGSFSYSGSPATLGKASLTSFNFADTLNVNSIGSSAFIYSLANLSSFSAVLNGSNLVSLSLATQETGGTSGSFAPESFNVTSLSPNGAFTESGGTLTFLGQASQVTAVTPEPSSFALLCTGLLGMAGVVRKRFA